jgi:hypothetical protein
MSHCSSFIDFIPAKIHVKRSTILLLCTLRKARNQDLVHEIDLYVNLVQQPTYITMKSRKNYSRKRNFKLIH